MLFPFAIVVMLPLTVVTAPLTVGAAALLRSGGRLTTAYGALAGALIGGPWARAAHGLELWHGATLLGLCAAGAAFAQSLWALCIRQRAAPGVVCLPQRIRAWWSRRSLGAKVLPCGAGVLVLLSAG
jgi:hypothetical protein